MKAQQSSRCEPLIKESQRYLKTHRVSGLQHRCEQVIQGSFLLYWYNTSVFLEKRKPESDTPLSAIHQGRDADSSQQPPPLGLNNCSSWQPTAPAATHYVRQTPCYGRFLGGIEMHSDNTSKIASFSSIHEFCWVHNSTHQEAKNAMLRFLRFFVWYGLS